MKDILLLGASGNIGNQVLDIIKENPKYQLVGISIGNNVNKGLEILTSFSSIKYFYSIKKLDDEISASYPHVTFFYGTDGLGKICQACRYDMLVNALVGFVGLLPTLIALEKDKIVALSNKESLVVGGQLINSIINKGKGKIIPIDSEHVAIDKCLLIDNNNVKRLVLTASGGAFRKLRREQLKHVTKDDALKHPTWNMGHKITIDCATMMNKCFEIIEAYYLFGNICDRIDILLHDESMIHSMVQYKNGCYRAEISKPDMHNPIAYAMCEREEVVTTYLATSYKKFGSYHFHKFKIDRYPLVKYASQVINKKGVYGCVLNASNEEAVYAFLKNEISFLDIEYIVEKCMDGVEEVNHINYDVLVEFDNKTRIKAQELIRKLR